MFESTLCYIHENDRYLLLHRVKKKNDLNEGKWIGVGGHVEPGETPEMCVRREVMEETGLTLNHLTWNGIVDFISDRWESEIMYLYTSDSVSGTLKECDEGDLAWISKNEIPDLPQWEGDRLFLTKVAAGDPFFHMQLVYHGDTLVSHRLLPRIILASASPRRREIMERIGLLPECRPSHLPERPHGKTPREIVEELSFQKAENIFRQFVSGFSPKKKPAGIRADAVEKRTAGLSPEREPVDTRADAVEKRTAGLSPEREPAGIKTGTAEEHATGTTLPKETFNIRSDSAMISLSEPSPEKGIIVIGADTVVAADGKVLGKPRSHAEAAEMIRRIAGRTHHVFTGLTIFRPDGSYETLSEETAVDVYPMSEEEIAAYAASEEPMDKAGGYAIQGHFSAFIKGINGSYDNVVGLPAALLYQHIKQFL